MIDVKCKLAAVKRGSGGLNNMLQVSMRILYKGLWSSCIVMSPSQLQLEFGRSWVVGLIKMLTRTPSVDFTLFVKWMGVRRDDSLRLKLIWLLKDSGDKSAAVKNANRTDRIQPYVNLRLMKLSSILALSQTTLTRTFLFLTGNGPIGEVCTVRDI